MNLKSANENFVMLSKADEFQNAHAQMSTFRKQKLIPSKKAIAMAIYISYMYILLIRNHIKILLHIAIDIDRYTNTPK